MTDFCDWVITLAFRVRAGNEDGAWTEAILDAALAAAPSGAKGFVADTSRDCVYVTFTDVESSEEFVNDLSAQMREEIPRRAMDGGAATLITAC